MFTAAEIRDNLSGAFLIMKGDQDGLDLIDRTVTGFWRSFGAFFLILPAYLLTVPVSRQYALQFDQPWEPVTGTGGALLLLAWLMEWLLFPLVMSVVATPLGIGRQYVQYIVARNWGSVIVAGVYAVFLLLFLVGFLPAESRPLVSLAILSLGAFVHYNIARTTLAVQPGLAVGLVVADFFLSFFIIVIVPAPY